MPITIKVVSSNPVHGEVYSIQYYVIKLVRFPPPIKLTAIDTHHYFHLFEIEFVIGTKRPPSATDATNGRYCQTCIKRSPSGQRKSRVLRQVTS